MLVNVPVITSVLVMTRVPTKDHKRVSLPSESHPFRTPAGWTSALLMATTGQHCRRHALARRDAQLLRFSAELLVGLERSFHGVRAEHGWCCMSWALEIQSSLRRIRRSDWDWSKNPSLTAGRVFLFGIIITWTCLPSTC